MITSHSDNTASDKWLCIWCYAKIDNSLNRCNNCGTLKTLPSAPSQQVDSTTAIKSDPNNEADTDNISISARPANPLLIKCESCSWQFSKRAQQCPKCGWKPLAACRVCQHNIPSDSTSCPECGDPEPFDSNHASRESVAPRLSTKASDEFQRMSLNTRAEIDISKSGQLGRSKPSDTTSAKETTSTVKRSIFIATIMTILALFLNASLGDKKPHNMYWTWAWFYLTAEIWKYWGWKALIPYPAYIVVGSVLSIIVAQNSSDMMVPLLVMAIANIIGLVIFYIAYRRARRTA